MSRRSDWVTLQRAAIGRLMDVRGELNSLRSEYAAGDYGNTLTADDLVGANADLEVSEIVAAMGSLEALDTALQSGHATNLVKVRS